jgi:hypothetical protein
MAKFKRYRVAHMFNYQKPGGGEVFITNAHEEEIRAMPKEVRDDYIGQGLIVEYDPDEGPPVPLTEANATPAKKKE